MKLKEAISTTMKTYYVQFSDFREEKVKSSSVRTSATVVSFYRNKSLVLAFPVSEFRRIAETPFKSYDELEQEKTAANEPTATAKEFLRQLAEKRKQPPQNSGENGPKPK